MKIIFVYLIFIFFTFPVCAQLLNIEKDLLEQEQSKKHLFLGNLSVHFSRKEQRRSLLSFGSYGNLIYTNQKHLYALILNNNFSQVNGSEILNDLMLHQRNTFWKNKKISFETFAQYQYDYNRGLDDRFQAGLGIKYHWKPNKKSTIAAGSGFLWETNHWRTEFIDTLMQNQVFALESGNLIRSNSYLSVMFEPSKVLSLNFVVFYQAPPTQFFFKKARILFDSSLSLKIHSWLSYNVRYAYTYDDVPENIRDLTSLPPAIWSLSQGLTVKF